MTKFYIILLLVLLLGVPVYSQEILWVEYGKCSWYGGKFNGRRTASGEIFNTMKYVAAHKTLPFGTMMKVTNLENGASVIVRIIDRGPFIKGRIIDVSWIAMKGLKGLGPGVINVKIEEIPKIKKIKKPQTLIIDIRSLHNVLLY